MLSLVDTSERIEHISLIKSDVQEGVEIVTNKQCIRHILSIPSSNETQVGFGRFGSAIHFPKGIKNLSGASLVDFPYLSTPIVWEKSLDNTKATLSINTEEGILECVVYNYHRYIYPHELRIEFDDVKRIELLGSTYAEFENNDAPS